MIKACIFDLDGTLADTLDSMAYVTNIIMEKFGLKTLPVDNFRYYSGKNLRYEKNDTLSEPLCGEFVAFFSCP